MRIPDEPWQGLLSAVGLSDLIDPRQDAWHTPVHRIVWGAVTNCQKGVSTEDRLRNYPCKRDNYPFDIELRLNTVDRVPEKSSTTLHKPRVLILGSRPELDSIASELRVRELRDHDA